MITKVDLFKELKGLYVAKKKPVLVEIPLARYLGIKGQGSPGGEEFQEAVGALYSMAFTVKMTSKSKENDYVVCKLEAIWTCENGDFTTTPQEKWFWQLMIRIPDFIEQDFVDQCRQLLLDKKGDTRVNMVDILTMEEGQCVQMLHIGPYDDEGITLQEMAVFAEGQGLEFAQHHHEIYLSDPRRVEPAKLKTILRHPVVKK